jgi:ZIP family zinc transporter
MAIGAALEAPAEDQWMPLYLSCIAGASTCLGAAVVFFHPANADGNRIVSPNTMSFSLALAGSVMVTVSVISIGPECLLAPDGEGMMNLWSFPFLQRLLSFGLGGTLYFLLSLFAFPEPEEVLEEAMKMKNVAAADEERGQRNTEKRAEEESSKISSPHDSGMNKNKCAFVRSRKKDGGGGVRASTGSFEDEEHHPLKYEGDNGDEDNSNCKPIVRTQQQSHQLTWTKWSSGADLDKDQRRAWRVAMLLFVSLLCHNFPEGLAVAASALESKKLGITVTVGIMIHNIPEGIAIAIPCLAARPDSPWLGFCLASLSGLAEPAGAFVALLLLRGVSQQEDDATYFNMENVLAFVAGIMIMVAMYELFPEARRHTSQGKSYLVAGTIFGIIVMVATELYF